jgi:4-amino-4-deoxy-L-arabinose transferase-like glycosyltransferase
MGIGLAVQGQPLDAVGVWDFAYGRDWNTRTSAQPSQEILFAGRQTNAVIGALVAASAFVLGRLMTNRVGGAIAGLFVAFHPLHVILSTQALSDQTLALLLMLIFIAGWAFAKRPTWSRAILLGVLLGLGGSVKLTPLLLALPLAGFGVLRLVWDRDRAAWAYAAKLVAQPAIAFATFVLSYPYLWPAPIRRSWGLYEFRLVEMEAQGSAWPDAAVDGPLDALARFARSLTEAHSPTRRLLEILYGRLEIDRAPVGLDFIPAAAGVIVLAWWVVTRGFWSPAAMVALLMGAEAAMLVVGMKTDFYRYHLPIIVIMAGCIGVSTGAAWQAITRRRGRTQHARQPVAAAARVRRGGTTSVPRGVPAYPVPGAQEAPR